MSTDVQFFLLIPREEESYRIKYSPVSWYVIISLWEGWNILFHGGLNNNPRIVAPCNESCQVFFINFNIICLKLMGNIFYSRAVRYCVPSEFRKIKHLLRSLVVQCTKQFPLRSDYKHGSVSGYHVCIFFIWYPNLKMNKDQLEAQAYMGWQMNSSHTLPVLHTSLTCRSLGQPVRSLSP